MKTSIKKIFAEVLNIAETQVSDDLGYNTISQWDSISHMALIAKIDDVFGISLDTQDVIELSSFAKAKDILKKYQVEVVC